MFYHLSYPVSSYNNTTNTTRIHLKEIGVTSTTLYFQNKYTTSKKYIYIPNQIESRNENMFDRYPFFFYIKFSGYIFFYKGIPINPLTDNYELSRHENLTFLWTSILRWIPRSVANHAFLCNTLFSNKLCPITVKILAVKGI